MRERLEEFMSRPVNCSFYPYSPIGDSGNNTNGKKAVVNLFNCLTIFSEFCQKSMRQSPSQSDLYIVSDRIISTHPQVLLEYFCEVNYPTTDGILTMTCQQIDLFWDGVLIKDIVQPELLKPYSGRDIAKRRAVYVVVLELHKLNLLNESNKATLRAELGCQQKCAPYKVVPMIKLK